MRRALMILLALAALPVLAWGGAALRASLLRHDWAEMDWNGDGRVALGEALHGADVGRRDVTAAGGACTEFFEFKDGRTLRRDCLP